MRTLLEYLVKDHTKNSTGNIFDKSGYKWIGRRLSPEELTKCKQVIVIYINEQIGNVPHNDKRFVEVYKDLLERFYIQYLQCEGGTMSDKTAQKELDRIIRIIDEMGIAQAEYTSLGQGWFHALAYLINNNII